MAEIEEARTERWVRGTFLLLGGIFLGMLAAKYLGLR